jgi:hypothetical protein
VHGGREPGLIDMAKRSSAVLVSGGRSGVRVTGSLADAIRQHKKDLQEKVFRSGAHAGAIVFYEEMKLRAPVDSGKLRDSIYRFHDDDRSTTRFQRYLVGPNKAKAQHWFNVEYGHWRYNAYGDGFWQKSKSNKNARVGTPGAADSSVHDLPGALDKPVWVPAVPYIRPTFDAVAGRAIEAARDRMKQRLQELKNGARDGD